MPKVSVIMPCYNHGRFVAESVQSILGQTFADLELLVIDDASEDDSVPVLQEIAKDDPRLKIFVHSRNGGVSRSRNDGLAAGHGDFIAFCDADDVWLPKKLAVQIASLEHNPQYDVVYSDATVIDEAGKETGRNFSQLFPPPPTPCGTLFGNLCLTNFVNTQTVLFRRKCLESFAGFDQKISFGEDWWVWIQLSRKHSFLYVMEALARYRMHRQSTNVAQQRRYPTHRFWVFRKILKSYPDLSDELRCQIWYHMGCCLRKLGRQKTARSCFQRSLMLSVHSMKSARNMARPLMRLAF